MKRRLQRYLFPVFCVGMLSLLLSALPRHTAAQDDEHGWTVESLLFPFNITLTNSCEGEEPVVLLGQAVIVTRQRLDNSGTLHIKEDWEISASGVGVVSGAEYTFLEDHNINIKQDDPFPYTYVEKAWMTLEGNGVPDQKVTYKVRLELNADGTIERDLFEFGLKCKK